MRGKRERMIGILLATTIIVSLLEHSVFMAHAQEVTAEKTYVITTEDEAVYDVVSEEVNSYITEDSSMLRENHVMIVEMTEDKAEVLSEKDGIFVEEDFILTGSLEKQNSIGSYAQKEDGEAGEIEYEWNLQAIHAQELALPEQDIKTRIKVAVMDSGVDFVRGIHLEGYVNLVEEEQYLPDMFQDMTGHGTGIAGIISGNGETGIYGVNPNAEVYSVRVLNKNNQSSLSRIIQGIYWCIEHDIQIINMSFGTPVYSRALEQAVKDAYEANILLVGAAGNENGEVEYPAAFPEVMAVASTNERAQISDFSNVGDELEIAAPGEKICTAGFFEGSVVVHGTSIAAPHVTGVASLLWEKDPLKSNEFIRQLIHHSSRELADGQDCGLLDAEYALQLYDAFEEKFGREDLLEIERLPQNPKKPENFELEEEAYVEGKWYSDAHEKTVEDANFRAKFSQEQIKIIKEGAVYPDTLWLAPSKYSPWHGAWKYIERGDYRPNVKINYAAVVEVITKIALANKDKASVADCMNVKGMDLILLADLINHVNEYIISDLGKKHTKEQRKLFLYGCGIHVLTDIFAHSVRERDNQPVTDKDNMNYLPRRYKAASAAAEYALINLKSGLHTDGEAIAKALNDTYDAGTKYQLINVMEYVTANGHAKGYESKLTQANVSRN